MALFTGSPANNSDTSFSSSSSYFGTNNNQNFGNSGGTPFYGAIRIPNVTIPQGSTVTACTLTFKVFNKSGSGTTGDLGFENVDDSPAFSSSSTQFSRHLVMTVSRTAFPVTALALNATGTLPGVEASLNEIVNRPGWVSGNAVSLMHNPATAGFNVANVLYSVTGGHTSVMTVTYVPGSGLPPVTDKFFQFI